jgi:hypothetical protein
MASQPSPHLHACASFFHTMINVSLPPATTHATATLLRVPPIKASPTSMPPVASLQGKSHQFPSAIFAPEQQQRKNVQETGGWGWASLEGLKRVCRGIREREREGEQGSDGLLRTGLAFLSSLSSSLLILSSPSNCCILLNDNVCV